MTWGSLVGWMTDLAGSPGWNLVTQPAVDVRSMIVSVNASGRALIEQALTQPRSRSGSRFFPPISSIKCSNFADSDFHKTGRRTFSARLWAARSIIEAEGIPLAYVSRADVVGLVFEAASRNDRVKVLLAHQNEILDDCDQAVASVLIRSTDRVG